MIKKFASFFVVFGFVIAFSECHSQAEMAIQPPERLSIGSEEIVLESAINNPLTEVWVFMSFKEPGIAQEYGVLNSPYRTFKKVADFLVYVRTNAVYFRNEILAWPEDIRPSQLATSKLYVVVWVTQLTNGQYDYTSDRVTLQITKDLGNFYDFSTNKLIDLQPHNVRSVTWITNISNITLSTQTPYGMYENQWSQETGSWTNDSGLEEVHKNILFLSALHSTGTNRMRATLRALGESTRTYTQAGEAIRPPVMSIDNRNVGVHLSRGTDTVLQSSINGGRDWLDETSYVWTLKTNFVLFPIETRSNGSLKIFRAKSY